MIIVPSNQTVGLDDRTPPGLAASTIFWLTFMLTSMRRKFFIKSRNAGMNPADLRWRFCVIR
jgi:hypothetical protein